MPDVHGGSPLLWDLYHVFSLSLRDIELILPERGVVVTHESVPHWCRKFSRLDPTITIPARTAAVIDVSRLGWKPPDPIQPNDGGAIVRRSDVRAAARPVANYILPGVEDIPPNSIGLLEANHAFIEAESPGALGDQSHAHERR